jgi:hypothetical protein
MEAMEPLAEPEVLVEAEARLLEWGLQVPMGTAAPEAMGEMLAWLEMVALVWLAQMAPLCPAQVAQAELEELED